MAFTNTNSLSTSLNQDPYYDDFNELKNFHRLLFRPGMAVQARELTQIQSILQNQVDRFASHVFVEGSLVHGGEITYDQNYHYVKLRDSNANNVSVNVASFDSSSITGGTSGVTAVVLGYADGSQASAPNTKTLFIKYTSSGTSKVESAFFNNEVLTSNNGFTANTLVVSSTGTGSAITVGESIIYAKDHFIRTDKQTLVLEKYSSNATFDVGFNIVEEIVTSAQDSTLLDPAQGSYNYQAPGADRLKLSCILTKRASSNNNATDFVKLMSVKDGVVQDQADKPLYAQIRDYLAQRTMDESGNYVVKGLNVRVREHLKQANNQGWLSLSEGGNTEQLAIGVEPGKAYVLGYDIGNLITRYLSVPKATAYKSIEAASIPANYGNYVKVNQVAGVWDIMGHDPVSLRDTVAHAVANSTAVGDFGTTSAAGSEIGTARVRALEYVSGTKGSPDAVYNLYLYDVRMTANSFSMVRSVYINNASLSDGKADVILQSNNAVLQETNFNRAVFQIPAANIKTLRDTSGNIDTNFRFLKKFDVTIATDGSFSISTGSTDEEFPFSTGVLNATQKRENFTVILNASGNTGALDGTVSMTDGSNTVSGTSTSFDTKLNVGDIIKIDTYANTFTVSEVTSATALKVLQSAKKAITTQQYSKEFKTGQVIDLAGVGGDDATRIVNVTSSTGASFDIQETLNSTISASVICELNKIDGREMTKTLRSARYVRINCNTHTAGVDGPWDLGFSDILEITSVRKKSGSTFSSDTDGIDVTSEFVLDSGQRDNYYDHGRLKKKSTSNLVIGATDFLLVKLAYFAHDTSQGVGYFSVDSYPIDDTNLANTSAISTQEIPVYTSPVDGKSFSLRDCIDIRPRITDTATDTTDVTSSSTNPATSTTVVEPSGGLHFIPPNDSLTADLDYYLKRRDIVVLDNAGKYRVIQGQPSLFPVSPPEPSDAIVLAKILIAPYPSLPAEQARIYNRPELACSVTPVRNERYTMRDIGALRDRIDRVEYYTSLSLLEKDAKDLLISDADGNNRFKNGILVDNFTGHNIGNVYDPDYKIAIDSKKGELRPMFRMSSVELFYSANSSGVTRSAKDATLTIANSQTLFANGEVITAGGASGTLRFKVDDKLYLERVSGTFVSSATAIGGSTAAASIITAVSTPAQSDIVTLPYTHDLVFQQPYASSARNAASLFYNWSGQMQLNPDSDYWVDTTQRPDVQVNFDLNLDNWQTMIDAWGTQWNDWQTNWRGENTLSTDEVSTGTFVSGTNILESFNLQSTVEVTEKQTRTGVQATLVPQTQTQNIGSRVVDVSIIPYMRSRVIKFNASGLKPDTKIYSFFDSESVSSYVTPANSSFEASNIEGSDLVTDSSGNVYGLFRIPNDDNLRFRVGKRIFRLSDSPNNSSVLGLVTTSAEAEYNASGLVQTTENTVISTRIPTIQYNTISETRSIQDIRTTTRSGGTRVVGQVTNDDDNHIDRANDDGDDDGDDDPIAQTFKVNDFTGSKTNTAGVFVTKIDLFFFEKDKTYPVFIELREVDPTTSYVTNRVVPFSQVILQPSQVHVSDDASKPTPIVFRAPIYLLNDVEYAIVVRPAATNPNYKVWIARLGEIDTLTGNRIDKQPYAGTLFASGNARTWQSIQDEDMKFNIYLANFTTDTQGTVVLKNEPKEYLTIANVSNQFIKSGELVHGESSLTLNLSPSVNVGTYASLTGTPYANGEVTFVSGTTVRVKDVTLNTAKYAAGQSINFRFANGQSTGATANIVSVTVPSGKVDYYDSVNASNTYLFLANTSGGFAANTWIKSQTDGRTAKIVTIDNPPFDLLNLDIQMIQLNKTTAEFSARLATSGTARESDYNSINVNNNTELSNRRFVVSRSNEITGLSGEKSIEIRGALSTSEKRHSPVIDLQRTSSTVVQNLINNDSTGEANTAGGSAAARYITRKVTLADGQDAEDLKVYITAYKPASSDVELYYKILNNEDGDDFTNRSWVQMVQSTSSAIVSDSENVADFKEYEYSISEDDLTGPNAEVQYVNSQEVTFTGFKYFAIKIVLKSTNPSKPPRLSDVRAIALQK